MLIIGADHGESAPPNDIAQQNPEALLSQCAQEKAVGVKHGSIDDHFRLPVIVASVLPPADET